MYTATELKGYSEKNSFCSCIKINAQTVIRSQWKIVTDVLRGTSLVISSMETRSDLVQENTILYVKSREPHGTIELDIAAPILPNGQVSFLPLGFSRRRAYKPLLQEHPLPRHVGRLCPRHGTNGYGLARSSSSYMQWNAHSPSARGARWRKQGGKCDYPRRSAREMRSEVSEIPRTRTIKNLFAHRFQSKITESDLDVQGRQTWHIAVSIRNFPWTKQVKLIYKEPSKE